MRKNAGALACPFRRQDHHSLGFSGTSSVPHASCDSYADSPAHKRQYELHGKTGNTSREASPSESKTTVSESHVASDMFCASQDL